MKRVFVALSGGVDSSVAAKLLLGEGYDVTGVFMKNWTRSIDANGRVYCPWEEDLAAARAAAAHLGIPLKIYNFEREYHDQVVRYFFREYSTGRTPNPDVMCNREIKFGAFLVRALGEGADYIATGHYVRLRRKSQNWELLRGIDPNKDQSYFLWAINPTVLKHSLFPIGEYTKPQVREMAREFGLPNADRKDSQGICFIGPISVQDFLREQLPVSQGVVRSASGEVLGSHQGTHFLTIGQRHGVGAATGQPVYVADKDAATNTVWVDEDWPGSRLYSRQAFVGEINWFDSRSLDRLKAQGLTCEVQVRYRQKPVKAVITAQKPSGSKAQRLTVRFSEPVRAVTEGQSLVCYNGDQLIGGGVMYGRR
ncbi:MAG: tRNA 2-thiouridine(34) synthase MnmA [Patescibacteria group bacterium]